MEENTYIFVYGSLKKEYRHKLGVSEVFDICTKYISEGTINAKMVSLVAFPGIISGNPEDVVHGEIYHVLPKYKTDFMSVLDRIESYFENNLKDSMYHRKLESVSSSTGTSFLCYVYWFNYLYLPFNVKYVPSGIWKDKETEVSYFTSNLPTS